MAFYMDVVTIRQIILKIILKTLSISGVYGKVQQQINLGFFYN